MCSAAIYSLLSDKKESEQEHTAGDRSETSLLDENGLFFFKKRGNLRRHLHWIVHFLSVITMTDCLLGYSKVFRATNASAGASSILL